MANEYNRTDRVADHLRRELATLIQRGMRDPRLGMVSVTDVEVSRDLAHARVFYTSMDADSTETATEISADSDLQKCDALAVYAPCRLKRYQYALDELYGIIKQPDTTAYDNNIDYQRSVFSLGKVHLDLSDRRASFGRCRRLSHYRHVFRTTEKVSFCPAGD